MSKSLKNFETIKDALKSTYNSRSMRVVFLHGRWNDGVEITPSMRKQAEAWETTVNVSRFFDHYYDTWGGWYAKNS